jgi:hypothetical protein
MEKIAPHQLRKLVSFLPGINSPAIHKLLFSVLRSIKPAREQTNSMWILEKESE